MNLFNFIYSPFSLKLFIPLKKTAFSIISKFLTLGYYIFFMAVIGFIYHVLFS